MNEKLACNEMMDCCKGTSNLLFVADRGFASYNVVAHAVNNKHKFLIRLTHPMAKNIFRDTVNLDEVDTCDIEDTFYVGRVRNSKSKQPGTIISGLIKNRTTTLRIKAKRSISLIPDW